MIAQIVKLASLLGAIALLFAAAVENRWLGGGADGLLAYFSQRDTTDNPAPMPPHAVSSRRPEASVRGVSSSAVPSYNAPSFSGGGVVELQSGPNAQFITEVEVNGARIRVLVDTGASHVMLTAEDARAANIDPRPEDYTVTARTANGTAQLAASRLRDVRVGGISVANVDALVARPGEAGISLLGMTFLKKLGSFQVADGHFLMKQ